MMLLLHILLMPLIVLPVLGLLRRKFYRDAAIYGVLAMAGYGLWWSVVNHRPLIITIFLEKIMKGW